MIGDRLMNEPLKVADCKVIYEAFGMVVKTNSDYFFENASQLVRSNNEVYNMNQPIKHQNKPVFKIGDVVAVEKLGYRGKLIDIQYGHDRYQLNNVSGWEYGIDDLTKVFE